MCIVFWQVGSDADHSLILAANRDEFTARPTTSAAWHDFSLSPSEHTLELTESNRTLSGLDLEAGGTWFGIALSPSTSTSTTPRLRFATLTNFTESIVPSSRPSRGRLVSNFLSTFHWTKSLEEYLDEVDRTKADYAGFNLLLGELGENGEFRMGYASNREREGLKARVLDGKGEGEGEAEKVFGLSNYTLEADEGEELWPKVRSGCAAFSRAVQDRKSVTTSEDGLVAKLWDVLSTANPTPVTARSHLRHTVLVRPVHLNPKAPYPLPNPTPFIPSSSPPPALDDLSMLKGTPEGEDGGRWYATCVQTVLLVRRKREGEGKMEVVMREREAYVLDKETRLPRWSGKERRFEFEV